ncbi:hypothetical protein [Azospirillum tabaci]|uniref:hypothetical protein n=1 Tax=Azospirillum tabaci TaxID=2752310 RepID=UPI0016617853|nr:hypothetical protein [Azospirillum tabaci]
MQPSDLLAMAGAAAVPLAGLLWFMIRMSWNAAKRDAMIDGLARSLDLLKERVDDHDDLRERMARMEQSVHDVRGSLQRIESALRTRPATGDA